jgi:hypothetical protein
VPGRRRTAARSWPATDDLITLRHSRKQVEQVKAALAGWLATRSTVFNEDKTRIAHLPEGVELLGSKFAVHERQVADKPSKDAVRRVRKCLSVEVWALRGSNADEVTSAHAHLPATEEASESAQLPCFSRLLGKRTRPVLRAPSAAVRRGYPTRPRLPPCGTSPSTAPTTEATPSRTPPSGAYIRWHNQRARPKPHRHWPRDPTPDGPPNRAYPPAHAGGRATRLRGFSGGDSKSHGQTLRP